MINLTVEEAMKIKTDSLYHDNYYDEPDETDKITEDVYKIGGESFKYFYISGDTTYFMSKAEYKNMVKCIIQTFILALPDVLENYIDSQELEKACDDIYLLNQILKTIEKLDDEEDIYYLRNVEEVDDYILFETSISI